MLALQREQRRSDPNSPLLPLIIMTSEDTDLPTRALIDRLGGLGLEPTQLHVVRQQKVPCLVVRVRVRVRVRFRFRFRVRVNPNPNPNQVPCLEDSTARLATLPSDRYTLLTKPHGHGDVHVRPHTLSLPLTLAVTLTLTLTPTLTLALILTLILTLNLTLTLTLTLTPGPSRPCSIPRVWQRGSTARASLTSPSFRHLGRGLGRGLQAIRARG